MDGKHDGFRPDVPDERPLKRPKLSAQLVREVGLMRNIPGDKDSGFVGSASGIYFIRSVYDALRRSQTSVPMQAETPGSEIVPGEDDHLTSIVPDAAAGLWKEDEVDFASGKVVSFQDLTDWSATYFSNWHPFYPFLHAPTVLQSFDNVLQDGLPHEEVCLDLNVVIIRSIMSISLADRRQAGTEMVPVPANLVFSSYETAIESLQLVLSRPTTELGLQAALSVQLFLVSMLRLNAASRLGGLINRMAVQLGLHRCPTRYSTFTISEKHLRRRILWSLYSLDRFICQSMGLPLGINDDDIDVCFPLQENHHAASKGPQNDRILPPEQNLRQCAFLARQMRLRGDIIELRNKSLQYVQKNPDQATSITAKLTQWWNEVESCGDPGHSSALSPYQSTILTLLKHESIISLHRPVLAAAQEGAIYDMALQSCIGSARSIITTLHNAISSEGDQSDSRKSLTLLWPSCTWAIWISTFVLFYAANKRHLSSGVVARLADRSLEVLQHLARRGSSWPEASAAAIRDLCARMNNRGSSGKRKASKKYISRAMEPASSQPRHTESRIFQRNSDYGLPEAAVEEEDRKSNATTRNESNADGTTLGHIEAQTWEQNDTFVQSLDIPLGTNYVTNITPINDTTPIGWDDFMYTPTTQSNNDFQTFENFDPFSGFDIPFWFDQDQHWDIFQDFN